MGMKHATELAGGSFDLIVNCLAIGASTTEDTNMFPARGVLVYLYAPTVTGFYEDIDRPDGDLTYIVPQECGLIACAGVSGGETDFNLKSDAEECQSILRRCRDILPVLRDAPVVGEWVGLRPKRKGGIRLDHVQEDQFEVINNYGHGGSGVVLSWGCAHKVAV